MIISVCLVVVFFLICTLFGFLFLNKITNIKSLLFLIPFSVIVGFSFFVFICHLSSFIIGPRNSPFLALTLLLISTVIIHIINPRSKLFDLAFSGNKFAFLVFVSAGISAGTLFSAYKFGVFDDSWHIPLAESIFQNNIYPPRDFLRPDYPLAYHFGGDLLAGSIKKTCKLNIYNSFELIAGIFSGVTFLSLFTLSFGIVKNYNVALLTSFCSFFGGSLTWLYETIKYILTNHKESFLQYFLNRAIHGTIIDAPSLLSFSSSASIGIPVLILCFYLYIKLYEPANLKREATLISTIVILLFSLSLFAGWLSLTFLISSFAFWIIFIMTSQDPSFNISKKVIVTLVAFFILNTFFGNQMYSHEHFLGRANIFNMTFKSIPFTITAWDLNSKDNFTHVISVLNFKFISAFGVSLLLIPLICIYLRIHKDELSKLLIIASALTMPLPLLLEFKLNPVDFNRLFVFGNIMLVLIGTIALCKIINIHKNKILILMYAGFMCLSSILGLILGTLYSPKLYLDTQFTQNALKKLSSSNSLTDFIKKSISVNKDALKVKYYFINKYKKETDFFKQNGDSGDVAISSIPGISIYSGVYTLIPSMMYGLKGQIYSSFDNIYSTIISTLDPHLLHELNVKWIGFDELSKSKLSKETFDLLSNNKIFMPVYKNKIRPEENTELFYEIYHVEDLQPYIEATSRKTGWILVNKDGSPIEIIKNIDPNISLFSTEKKALAYLKEIHQKYPKTNNELITAQPIVISITEQQLKENMLSINLEMKS
ncbi:MAG: hypothetical protein HYY52_06125 [Candidatus Melainabacteria bacterium]|nr:hypothetical protein [Candidatus Melainabacteria bacterium]